MYRPLPTEVTIKKSYIDGLGLFSTCSIDKEYHLGITHIANLSFANHFIRTPLGGFINHSSKPNCKLVERGLTVSDNDDETVLILVTKQLIPPNTELTTHYSLYEIPDEETL